MFSSPPFLPTLGDHYSAQEQSPPSPPLSASPPAVEKCLPWRPNGKWTKGRSTHSPPDWRPSTAEWINDPSPPTPPLSPSSPPLRALQSNNWRERSSFPTTPALRKKSGEIYYLPSAESCQGSIIKRQLIQAKNEQAYDHPVVVLMTKIVDEQEIVLIRIGTSVRGQGISAKKERHQRDYLLVEDGQTQPHLDTQPLKRVSGSDTFEVATYINRQQGQMYEIEAKHLELFNRGRTRITLDQAAVRTLLSAGCNREAKIFTPQEISAAAQLLPARN